MTETPSSPRWSTDTKRIVSLLAVAIVVYVLFRFPIVVRPLLLASLLAYLLGPLADRLTRHFKFRRAIAAVLLQLLVLALIVLLIITLVPAVIREIRSFKIDFSQIQATIAGLLDKPLIIGGQTINLQNVYQQLSENLNSLIQPLLGSVFNFVVDVAQGLLSLILVLVISFYILKDAASISAGLERMAPPDYLDDYRRLRAQIGQTWNAFFRGQLILGLVMGLVVGLTMWLLGVRNALLIGLLFGLLEVVPNFGPIIASIPTLFIAYFTGSTWLPVSNEVFLIIVLVANIALQQIENIVLVPRIMGHHLNLHPVVVLLGAIAGASLAGVLGILLAAPMLATARVIGHYAYAKLLNVDPFEMSL
jgi:predicted PurR-regulated permease PerM